MIIDDEERNELVDKSEDILNIKDMKDSDLVIDFRKAIGLRKTR